MRKTLRLLSLLAALLLAGPLVRAQTPTWGLALVAPGMPAGTSTVQATATDASGNVFVTGNFSGQAVFGSTVLTSAGADDMFVAKYVPATATWAWAQRGGGTDLDAGQGIALQGASIYVTGGVTNDQANTKGVTFGGTTTLSGASATASQDMFVVKYTDLGTAAAVVWTQVGGGTQGDKGMDIAVSGPSLYVVGFCSNSSTNRTSVVFGGSGTTPGTVPQYGTQPYSTSTEVLVAKYTDLGPAAAVAWTQVGGGSGVDFGEAVAVRGSSVYVTAQFANDRANTADAKFGGAGTVLGTQVQAGATTAFSPDVLVLKYTDQGSSAVLNWTQVGGGTGTDGGYDLAVSGTSVYVVGNVFNSITNANQVVFGGSGTTAGTAPQYGVSATASYDLLLAKYTDNGSNATLGWTQIAGGDGFDFGQSVVASGTGVYVVGTLFNSATDAAHVLLGGTGTAPGTVGCLGVASSSSYDVLLAKYTDLGSAAAVNWANVGGGAGGDLGYCVAMGDPTVVVGGTIGPGVPFGGAGPTSSTGVSSGFLAALTLGGTLAAAPVTTLPGLTLYPNPAHGTATVRVPAGAGPTTLTLLDALSRVVRTATALAGADYALNLQGLSPGVYALRVRVGEAQAVRQVVVE